MSDYHIYIIYAFVRQIKIYIMNKKDTKITIRLDEDFIAELKEYCRENGYTISGRVRTLLKKDMDNEK